ncbi:hypothetical protein [Parvibaculum sp.]|uniref:hypothetical protein n=1 Tax=Parvibaculum sp. TaxID=2024848 RepID=UPI0039FC1249
MAEWCGFRTFHLRCHRDLHGHVLKGVSHADETAGDRDDLSHVTSNGDRNEIGAADTSSNFATIKIAALLKTMNA